MIAINMKCGKGSTRFTYKHIAPQNRHQSVTSGRNRGPTLPAKVRDRLQPWLDLANLLPPPPSREKSEHSVNDLIAMNQVGEWRARIRAIPPSELLRRFERSR